jgi:hypothetical protein
MQAGPGAAAADVPESVPGRLTEGEQMIEERQRVAEQRRRRYDRAMPRKRRRHRGSRGSSPLVTGPPKSKKVKAGLTIAVFVLTTVTIIVLVAVLLVRPPDPMERLAGPREASGPSQQAEHATSAAILPAPERVEGRNLLAAGDDGSKTPVDTVSTLVEVSVRDARTDMPIGGAAVSCDGVPVALTNSEGHASFATDAGRMLEVRATAHGCCPGIDRVRAEPGVASVEASLTLVPEAEVYGLVRGPDGAPARDAEVVLHLDNPGFMRPVASGVDGLESGARARTDGEGAFSFAGIGSRKGLWRARVTVLHDRCARFDGEAFDLRNGAVVGPLLCNLTEGATIGGRVTTSGAGARATIFLAEGGAHVETDAMGRYELLHVPPGPATLCASLSDQPGIRASIPLDMRPGEDRVQDVALDYEKGLSCTFSGSPRVLRTPA